MVHPLVICCQPIAASDRQVKSAELFFFMGNIWNRCSPKQTPTNNRRTISSQLVVDSSLPVAAALTPEPKEAALRSNRFRPVHFLCFYEIKLKKQERSLLRVRFVFFVKLVSAVLNCFFNCFVELFTGI